MNLEKEVGHLAKLLFWILPFLVAVSVYFLYASSLGAGSNVALSGFAWSGNTGWISFNCANTGNCPTSNYVVSMDQDTGFLSGYALSDNIGWVQAYTSPTGCPVSPCEARVNRTTGRVTGWFKALAGGAAQSGGWDGWIQLSDSSGGVSVNDAGTAFQGYAWGADVMGWVDMSGVLVGENGDGDDDDDDSGCPGNAPKVGGECPAVVTDCPGNAPRDADGNCPGGGGGTDLCTNIPGDQLVLLPTQTRNAATGECAEASATTPSIAMNIWRVFPSLLRRGEDTEVYWHVSNAQSCTVRGTNGNEWTGTSSDNNNGLVGKKSSPITAKTTYTLKCTDLSNVETVYLPLTVNVIPSFNED